MKFSFCDEDFQISNPSEKDKTNDDSLMRFESSVRDA